MKIYISILVLVTCFLSAGNVSAQQSTKTNQTVQLSPLEKLAKKRTQLLKDELFLSNDQTSDILKINIDMLKKLEVLNAQKLDKANHKKQLEALENYTKSQIVSLLTPAQRERFETKLFAQVYQTHVDKKAVSVNKKK